MVGDENSSVNPASSFIEQRDAFRPSYRSAHVGVGGSGRMKIERERERENQLALWMN